MRKLALLVTGLCLLINTFSGSAAAAAASLLAAAGSGVPARPLAAPFDSAASGLGSGATLASTAWGDFDNDGLLDIVVSGRNSNLVATTTLYHQNSDHSFAAMSGSGYSFSGVFNGALAWGDYDNNGLLDLVVAGQTRTGTYLTQLYHNDGAAGFSLESGAGFAFSGVAFCALAWGDYNNDGLPDLLVTGDNGAGGTTTLYRQHSDHSFSVVTGDGYDFAAVSYSAVAWGDFNNDGRLDFAIAGLNNNSPFIEIYRNAGVGGFARASSGLAGVYQGALAWGDYDNDGRLDLIVAGQQPGGAYATTLYHQNSDNSFSALGGAGYSFTGVQRGAVAWGDYDNDGLLDLAISGQRSNGLVATQLYHNDGSGFSLVSGLPFRNVYQSALAWGDYDNDGKLDLAISGADSSGTAFSALYHNQAAGGASAPLAPTSLQAQGDETGSTITFSWHAASDAETGAAGLSYNLRVGSTPGGGDVFSTMAATTGGARRIAARGPIQGLTYKLSGLTRQKKYYWSVQAVDAELMGGAFAAESTAWLGFVDSGSGIGSVSNGALAWGDYDGDGKLDLALSGLNSSFNAATRLYHNEGNGSFSLVSDSGLESAAYTYGSLAWGDWDNDGKLDLAISGKTRYGQGANIYHNDGGGHFSAMITQAYQIAAVAYSALAWGDYDGDGLLDLALSGYSAAGLVTNLYRNTGAGFSLVSNEPFPATWKGSLRWGDYDNDGRPDLLVTGCSYNPCGDSGVTRVYRNTSNGFVLMNGASFTFAQLYNSSAVWGDYDNDGKLDFAVAGLNPYGNRVTTIYRNTGAGFAAMAGAGFALTPVTGGALAWGDYNNDGLLDLVVSGTDANSQPQIALYTNTGSGFSSGDTGVFPANEASPLAWGDYDNDGKLDLAVAGANSGLAALSAIYHNGLPVANTPPAAPTNLSVSYSWYDATLSWDAPTDAQTAAAGLSYNLRVGTTPNGCEVVAD